MADAPIKRKRGRPRKHPLPTAPTVKRPRGRPKKIKQPLAPTSPKTEQESSHSQLKVFRHVLLEKPILLNTATTSTQVITLSPNNTSKEALLVKNVDIFKF